MGCGSSTAQKVSPTINASLKDAKPKQQNETPVETITKTEANNNKSRSLENVKPPSSDPKLLTKRPSSHSGSIKSVKESPKAGAKSRKLVRDSRGSVRPASATSTNSELERNFSADIRKRESVGKLFQASSSSSSMQEKPTLPPIGGNAVKLQPLAFDVPLDTKPPKSRPPRRLESLKNAPKLLTQKELEEKLRQSEERRELEIQRKKLKSSRMSRRKRELVEAKEQSKQQEQAEEMKGKMDATTTKRERLQAEVVEKQRKRMEHAEKVRERAKKLKQKKEMDEGLGGEMETYKGDTEDEGVNNWSATENKETTSFIKTETSTSINSHASLDTVDSGVPTRNIDDSIEQFYNA